jgi:hypothetical protein
MTELTDLELLDALGLKPVAKKQATLSAIEERIIAGFEDIQRFVSAHERLPTHGEGKDIFERLYATRLDQIRRQPDCRALLEEFDHQGVLEDTDTEALEVLDELDDNALLAELGVTAETESDITTLRHVKPRAEIRAADEIANRTVCKDFDQFKVVFRQVQQDLSVGIRKAMPFRGDAEVEKGYFFILDGQKVVVAEKGEVFLNENDRKDSRLRVIYDNGTESDMLMRSLQRALNKDENGRRISEVDAGPLFANVAGSDDQQSGTIYICRSESGHPEIKKIRKVLHKIGVTGGNVDSRIANAENDPTYLMAKVKVVATYELFNINRKKLERLLHRFFQPARLDIQIKDRFGKPIEPREWFCVPLPQIEEAVERIQDGSIKDYGYDSGTASLIEVMR